MLEIIGKLSVSSSHYILVESIHQWVNDSFWEKDLYVECDPKWITLYSYWYRSLRDTGILIN